MERLFDYRIDDFIVEKGLKQIHTYRKVNYTKIPVYNIQMNESGIEEMNYLLDQLPYNDQDFTEIVRTKSGGISIKPEQISPLQYDVRALNNCVEITWIGEFSYRFQLSTRDVDKSGKPISGRKQHETFWKKCKEFGIYECDYEIDYGMDVKKTIPKPLINTSIYARYDREYTNVHHIDFHNSYPGGLQITHPEFRPVVEFFYNKRKEDPMYKAVLNYTIGFMQSSYNSYAKHQQLSRDAIQNNNDRIEELAEQLENSDRTPLLFNTDGIWYQGEVYHGDGEGNNVGEWENDHTNCTLRIKSDGCYEFIEDGQYHPVVRGFTKLDREKSRDSWQWGDIYQDNQGVNKCALYYENGHYKMKYWEQ